jgi:hypothetical protein
MSKLFTIGYTSTNPEELKQIVSQHAAQLWDIRFKAWSPAPQWRPENFKQLVGDRYHQCRALGNVNYQTGGEIKLHNPYGGLVMIRELCYKRGEVAILMCGCREHEGCHRTVAAEYIKEHLEMPIEIEHLYGSRRG